MCSSDLGKLRRGAARQMLAAGKLSLVFETRYDDCDGSVAGVRGEEEETAAKSEQARTTRPRNQGTTCKPAADLAAVRCGREDSDWWGPLVRGSEQLARGSRPSARERENAGERVRGCTGDPHVGAMFWSGLRACKESLGGPNSR